MNQELEKGSGRGEWGCSWRPMRSSNTVRLTHEGVLVPSIGFRLVVVKSLILDWHERAITICGWHDGFRENSVRLGAGVTKVRVPILICRTDGTEGIISVRESVFVFLLARGAPDGIKDVLALRRRLWSKVRPNGAAVRPHYWLVVLRAPLGRGGQHSSMCGGFESHTRGFRVFRIADSPFGEIFFTQWAILI